MDKIVSTVYFEGSVYVFTETGIVFEMTKDFSGMIVFRKIAELRLS